MHESVAIIIFNETKDQVLLIKRRDIPVWALPGGGIEVNESAQQAAIRETLEETGLQVELIRKVAHYLPQNRLSHFTYFFEARATSGTLKLTDETQDIAFFPLTALPKMLPPFYKEWIHDALSNESETMIKPLKGTSYFHLIKYSLTHPILTLRFLLSRCGIHFNN